MGLMYFLLLFAAAGAFAVYPDINISKLFSAFFLYMIYSQKIETEESKQIEDDKSTEEKKDTRYEDKYREQFRELICQQEPDLERLEYCYVMEYTPIGNVIMKYDKKRESFIYYSDHVVPFRFLEVVSRKYALTFHCKSLVIDSEKEIERLKQEDADKKEEKKREEEERQTMEKEGNINKDNKKTYLDVPNEKEKKNVFAKFKTYNKTSSGPAPANPKQQTIMTEKPDELVVETNRYSKDGPFSSFFLLQKTKKDSFRENATLTFAQFKKMQQQKKLSII